MAAFTSNPTKIYWDVPTIVGASVLELAKFQMYKFHYDIMTPNFECRLLCSDTDSLLTKSKVKIYTAKFPKKENFE